MILWLMLQIFDTMQGVPFLDCRRAVDIYQRLCRAQEEQLLVKMEIENTAAYLLHQTRTIEMAIDNDVEGVQPDKLITMNNCLLCMHAVSEDLFKRCGEFCPSLSAPYWQNISSVLYSCRELESDSDYEIDSEYEIDSDEEQESVENGYDVMFAV